MKRKMFFMGTLALVLAGVTFWSCQKNEELMDAEDGVMLKKGKAEMVALQIDAYSPEFEYYEGVCNDECIDPMAPVYWEMAGEETFINNPNNSNNPNSKTINYVVYNTENSFIVKLTYSRSNGSNDPEVSVTVDGESQNEILTYGVEKVFTFPLEIIACKEITWSFEEKDYDLPTALEYSGNYSLVGVCKEECTDWQTESAFAGEESVKIGDNGSWFYIFEDGEEPLTIWAGQNIKVGTADIVGGELVLLLENGWELDGDESVKVFGFETSPTIRPNPGQNKDELLYKGDELTIENMEQYDFYVIHLNVKKCAD